LYIHGLVICTSSPAGVYGNMEATGLPDSRSSKAIFIRHDSSPTLLIGGKVVRYGRLRAANKQIIRNSFR
jgi:hypothetical protein